MIKTITVAALAMAGSGLSLSLVRDNAQFEETIPASQVGIVTVRVTDGAVSIEGWDRDEVRVAGSGVNRDALDLQGRQSDATPTECLIAPTQPTSSPSTVTPNTTDRRHNIRYLRHELP